MESKVRLDFHWETSQGCRTYTYTRPRNRKWGTGRKLKGQDIHAAPSSTFAKSGCIALRGARLH